MSTATAVEDGVARRYRALVNVLLLLAAVAFAVGIAAPMITLKRLVVIQNTFSVLSGVGQLFVEQEYVLFIVVGVFSILLPALKITLLFIAWNRPEPSYSGFLRWMGILGRWSMLDVFVVAVLIATVKLAPLATMELHYGLHIFTASVLLVMLANQIIHWRVERIGRRKQDS